MPDERRLFGVTGWKNAGKTTLVAALVRELASRGYIVSTIKHAHHSFDIDHEGTDSWRHRKAGAQETLLVSRLRWALMHELDEDEPPLEVLIEKLAPCDLVLIEGYKRESHEKIEVIRADSTTDQPRWPDDGTIVALAVAERPQGCTLPNFDPDDVPAIADFIRDRLSLPAAGGRRSLKQRG
ncbi:MAG: molybdopterin-guanine dinucleotide biosynthesis protein B [Salaquimonas sp.]|nr:molybdopterin-guanine dinucleotide biosynthesis protein B [Salaquimonas sp.]